MTLFDVPILGADVNKNKLPNAVPSVIMIYKRPYPATFLNFLKKCLILSPKTLFYRNAFWLAFMFDVEFCPSHCHDDKVGCQCFVRKITSSKVAGMINLPIFYRGETTITSYYIINKSNFQVVNLNFQYYTLKNLKIQKKNEFM